MTTVRNKHDDALISNMGEELRDGYIVSAKMKKVWQIQLEMVVKLLEICKRHDLKIWAFGGTLLGAVRHGGYIPWDDDIDLVMFREDFDKLQKLPAEEFLPYKFQSPATEPSYIHPHGQMRNSSTAAILPIDINQTFDQGIFIDIMIHDFVPDNIDETCELLKRRDAMRCDMFFRNYNPSLFNRSFKTILSTVSRLIRYKIRGLYNIYKESEDIFLKYNNLSSAKVCSSLTGMHNYQRRIFESSWYDKTIEVPFENIKLPIPAEYDKCLKMQYGDYLTPAKAPTTHGSVIFDTERSYKEILKQLRRDKKKGVKGKLRYLLTPSPARN